MRDIIPIDKNNLHNFEEFNNIADFITKFDQFGVDSISTRYISTKNDNQKYKIHQGQSYLVPKKMHDNIKNILYIIAEYLRGDHFYFCNSGCFTEARIEELKHVYKKLEEYRPLFIQFKNDINKYPDTVDEHGSIVFDQTTVNNQWIKLKLDSELHKKILSLKQTDIMLIVLGFYFSNGIDCTGVKNI